MVNAKKGLKMNIIQNYGTSNYQLGFQSKNAGKKVAQQILNGTQHKKTYLKPETNNISLSTKQNLCDSRDLAMDRWERTNGHPELEMEDVQWYLTNGKYLSRSTGKICG